MIVRFSVLLVFVFAVLARLAAAAPPPTPPGGSALWAEPGPGREAVVMLPDFSRAGYREGEAPPRVAQRADVRAFGARGDGRTDDTRAIQDAIDATEGGAVFLPPGRYLVSDILRIRRSGVVLRGAGAGRSVLWFPRGLDAIHPRERKTSAGEPASGYSFDGAFVSIEGDFRERLVTRVREFAPRGARELRVQDASALRVGALLSLVAHEDHELTLVAHLYDNDPGDLARAKRFDARQLVRVLAVEGDRVRLDRALRFDLRLSWRPELRAFDPSVRESGVESLGFAFPPTPYAGHFRELGYNAIELRNVHDCWVRDVAIHNADLGVNLVARGCTFSGVRLTADRARYKRGGPDGEVAGHHGIQIKHAEDNLVEDFSIKMTFIHDLTVENAAGNVFARGGGSDLCLDHHKDTPYQNLFTALDLGRGTRPWMSGGGGGYGRHAAGGNVYWGFRADRDLALPRAGWGPDTLVFVGLRLGGEAGQSGESGLRSRRPWVELIPPAKLRPADLHAAQRARRRAAEEAGRP
jgi:hypothetical protein